MMKTAKEGRGRTTPNEMPTKIGKVMFYDLKNFGESGFSPFLEKSYLSKEFYNSKEEYQTMNFGSFQNHARRVAAQVVAVMTDAERKMEEARLARKLKDEGKIPKEASIQDTTSSPQNRSKSRVQSLRDTIVAAYPNGEMAIVIFELDGDIDGRAFELQFANNGKQIAVRSRVPVELTKAELLLGAKDRKPIQDADSMLLNQVIKERLKGCEKDDDGILWELREIIDLPFRCKKSLYNRIGNEIPSYLLRENKRGYAWGYFWVVGEHVGNKNEGPTTIRCKASSDDESDDESSQNDENSQLDSSEEEYQDMSLQYESLSDDSSMEEIERNLKQGKKCSGIVEEDMKKKIAELQHLNESKNLEIEQLKQMITEGSADLQRRTESVGILQQSVESKNLEIEHLKQLIKESIEQSADLNRMKENCGQLQQSLEAKNVEISKLQQIIHEYTNQKNNANELERNLESKTRECLALLEKINQLQEKLECTNNDLHDIDTKWKKEKVQRVLEKKSYNAETKKNKELTQKLKKMETEVHTIFEASKLQEGENEEKKHMIQQLESTVNQMQAEIKTRECRLAELQNVINWKDEQYQKIQVSLQAKFNQELTALQQRVQELHNQNIFYLHEIDELKTKSDHIDQNGTNCTEDDTPATIDVTIKSAKELCAEPLHDNSSENHDQIEIVVNDNLNGNENEEAVQDNIFENKDEMKTSDEDEKDAVIADDTVESVYTDCFENEDPIEFVEENDLKAYDTSEIDRIEESKFSDEREGGEKERIEEPVKNIFKEDERGSIPDVVDMTPEKGKLSKILFNKVNQKSSRQKEKKVAKKRQNQKKKLQEWKSQIEEEERKKASSAKVKLLRTEEEENEIIAQADDLSSCDPIDEKLWGFCDDEDVVERENFDEDKESCESNHTNENETTEKSLRNCNDLHPDTSSDDDSLPLNVSRKRKSAAYESFEESEQGPPMKKIRKSRRLEEKRLARLAKTKID